MPKEASILLLEDCPEDAELIEIDLTTDTVGLRLCVKDDGRGFSPPSRRQTGMGLRIMEHRVHAIGGVLTIASDPNRGTEVKCILPVAPDAASGKNGGSPRSLPMNAP